MSNPFFRFKQFEVQQDRCAMKVSTDACIQGAWTPLPSAVNNILDIGCGTGLLSLMLAQRHPGAQIDALELDAAASRQAAENCSRSPWSERIHVLQGDVMQFLPGRQYELIICNPPFFNNSLLGPQDSRNVARHTLTLTQEALLAAITGLLAPGGDASVLLPIVEHEAWEQLLARNGWHITAALAVKDNDNARIKRMVSCCSRIPAIRNNELLVIKQADGSYTEQFRKLMQAFYLYL